MNLVCELNPASPYAAVMRRRTAKRLLPKLAATFAPNSAAKLDGKNRRFYLCDQMEDFWASHGGAQTQPNTPRQISRVLDYFQTCGGHIRKALSSSRPNPRSVVPLAKRCIRKIMSREMYSGVPLEKP